MDSDLSNEEKEEYLQIYEDNISRLSLEAVLLRRAAGPHIASFLGLLRLDGELVLATYPPRY